jgi:hypothetical protein
MAAFEITDHVLQIRRSKDARREDLVESRCPFLGLELMSSEFSEL